MKKLLILALLVFVIGCGSKWDEEFQYRDINDDFCGPHINFKFCKCAFHGEYCNDPDVKAKGITSRSEANTYVEAKFNKWLIGEKDKFKQNCIATGGSYDQRIDTCYKCPPEKKMVNDVCQ